MASISVGGSDHPDTAADFQTIADVLRRTGQEKEACEALQAALHVFEPHMGLRLIAIGCAFGLLHVAEKIGFLIVVLPGGSPSAVVESTVARMLAVMGGAVGLERRCGRGSARQSSRSMSTRTEGFSPGAHLGSQGLASR